MRRHSLLFLALLTLGCHAQTPAIIEAPANLIIPNPAPAAPISAWKTVDGRSAISLPSGDVTLRGFSYTGTDATSPAILFFNGNGMTINGADAFYRHLASLGPTVVAYDYRGYGFSGGHTDLATFREDGLHEYDQLVAATPSHKVVVYGYSMGSATASYIASERKVAGLILAAAIASAEEEFPVYGRAVGIPASRLATMVPTADAKLIFGETALVAKSQAPLLVLHGDADTLVPTNQGREIYAASTSPSKQLVIVPGATHNQITTTPAASSAVVRFFSTLPK